MTEPLRPGLLVLHGNRLELLADTVFTWLRQHPLQPLEEEVFLVQSNGMAEWLKMELAAAQGVSAATRVELPARFLWRAYRAVLGRAAVPAVSAMDKLPLTWRFMRLLPTLAADPVFAPVAGFLQEDAGDAARRLQLAQRLADLFDQYQVYRSDWLHDWAAGRDQLRPAPSGGGKAVPLPSEQAWQPALWRAALAELAPADAQATRPLLQERFLHTLRGDTAPGAWPKLPRRIVLFGTTHLPQQTLDALAALKDQVQVLMAVPNPCRFHWADTLSGRELLQAARRRHPQRGEVNPASVPLQQLHAHGHPLLAAWGRQSRDFIRQLDVFDDVQLARERFAVPRVDLFDHEEPAPDPQPLLAQVQAHVRDLLPLAEHPHATLAPADRSIVFHIAHSAQREVEVLHDQLLHLLAQPPQGKPLAARDIVVMVPDIDRFAPAIRAVFGQHPRGHARHIPWGLADQRDRGRQPLLVALEWLLHAPQQRFSFSELRDLLDVPAIARRLKLAPEQLPTLLAWAACAGVRWGLRAEQRTQLGLGEMGDANTWHFGLRRLLLGYATGDLAEGFEGIEPFAEVAGLDAGLAGVLAEWLQALESWWLESATSRAPQAWAEQLRALVQAVFSATDDADRALLAALDDALAAWLQACEAADFTEALPLAAVREAWLDGVDDSGLPGSARRFKAGGVTFCTLLPLRAIPFEVVCLLGMNEGDYPRRQPRSDFDLLGLQGMARPGDRSRRDDDRQLMLDALLSARRVLYLSWAGRSVRDNSTQPPSVLVAQLRDYLAAGWHKELPQALTTEHPLQPFSRRYFEAARVEAASANQLFTYAAEWRVAHDEPPAADGAPTAPAAPHEAGPPATLETLAHFLRNPVKAFFRQRLQVSFEAGPEGDADDEAFASDGLEHWQQLDDLLRGARAADVAAEGAAEVAAEVAAEGALPLLAQVRRQVAKLQRAGRLPHGGPGEREALALVRTLQPMLQHWQALLAAHPQARDKLLLRLGPEGSTAPWLDDWLDGLRAAGKGAQAPVWLDLQPSRLVAQKKNKNGRKEPDVTKPRADKLLGAWLRGLAAAACGQPVRGVLVGADVIVSLEPFEPQAARDTLMPLLLAWQEAFSALTPLPTALRTGLAWLGDANKARTAFEGSEFGGAIGEGSEPCLARLYPDFAALQAEPDFVPSTERLYAHYKDWLDRKPFTIERLAGAELTDDEEGALDD